MTSTDSNTGTFSQEGEKCFLVKVKGFSQATIPQMYFQSKHQGLWGSCVYYRIEAMIPSVNWYIPECGFYRRYDIQQPVATHLLHDSICYWWICVIWLLVILLCLFLHTLYIDDPLFHIDCKLFLCAYKMRHNIQVYHM